MKEMFKKTDSYQVQPWYDPHLLEALLPDCPWQLVLPSHDPSEKPPLNKVKQLIHTSPAGEGGNPCLKPLKLLHISAQFNKHLHPHGPCLILFYWNKRKDSNLKVDLPHEWLALSTEQRHHYFMGSSYLSNYITWKLVYKTSSFNADFFSPHFWAFPLCPLKLL